MNRYSPQRAILILTASAALWAAIAGLCLLVGSTGQAGLPSAAQLGYRIEVILLASLVGAALGAAGVVYQAILRNPLADPYLLGVSSGASLLSYVWQFGLATSLMAHLGGAALSQQAFAFIGAAGAVCIVFLLASRRGRLEPVTLLLVGVIVNAVNGSIFLLVNAIVGERPGSGGPLSFLVGGINATVTRQQEIAATTVVGVGWVVMAALAGQLNVASLSESEAQSLGVRIHRLRWIALIAASLVTAAAVAISGPIGFVGLVCPHVARLLVGTDVRKLLPAATAIGAALLAAADAACRCIAGTSARTVLPVGVLTALLGGPFFLLLLWQSRRRGAPEGGR